MRLQGVRECVCVFGGGLISDEPWWESAGTHRCCSGSHRKRRKRRKTRGGVVRQGVAAPLWMISVSRTAGYGKFTQTNDSHLPEARDTIERGWRARRERGEAWNAGAVISDNYICMRKILQILGELDTSGTWSIMHWEMLLTCPPPIHERWYQSGHKPTIKVKCRCWGYFENAVRAVDLTSRQTGLFVVSKRATDSPPSSHFPG